MVDRPDDLDGWTRHAAQQRRAWRRLTYLERLRWLEQAKRFQAQALGLALHARSIRRVPSPHADAGPEADTDGKGS